MAQAGSNDEKNWKSKISLDCPFKKWSSLNYTDNFISVANPPFIERHRQYESRSRLRPNKVALSVTIYKKGRSRLLRL